MAAYVILFFITSIITFFRNRKNVTIVTAIIFIVLTLFAGTRNNNIDNDYALYQWLFQTAVNTDLAMDSEPTKMLIPRVMSWFSQYYVELTFFTYAAIGLYFKLFSIKNYRFFGLAVVLYVSNLFFIQDMTTIRASVASGILLWSLKDIIFRNDKVFFLKLFLAILFHNSSALFIVIWLINRFKIKYKWLFIALAFSIIVPILNLNFIKILHLDSFSEKAGTYLQIKEYEEGNLNLFNFKIIISFFYLAYLYWKRKSIQFRSFDILLKIHILSLILFFLFSPTGLTFSLRIFELLSIVQIVLFPLIILTLPKKFKIFGYIIVILTAAVFFYYNIFFSDLFKAYSSWLF